MVDLGAAVGGEGELAYFISTPFGFELLFGLAHGGQLRAGVDHARDKVVVDLVGLAGDAFDAGHRFVFGFVRQHRAGGDVANHPDTRHGSAVVVVAEHAALVGFQAHAFQVQPFGIGAAANGDQYIVGLQRFCGATGGRLQGQVHAIGAGAGLGHLAAQLEHHALLGQGLLQGLGGFFVGARADAVEVFDDRDLAAQAAPYRTQLKADHAGADDDQVLGHLWQRQRAGRVDDALVVDGHARQGRRFGAGGNDNVLGLQCGFATVLSLDHDLADAIQAAPALDPVDLVLAEQVLDALGQAGHALVLLFHHLGEVQVRFDFDTEVGELVTTGGFIQLGSMQQRLGGHAAHVQAGAAQGRAAFHAGYAQAQLAGADGCVVAARATADDHHVIGFHGFNSRMKKRKRGTRLS
ncbi:hypothetical protein D3C79_594070 [compost metagenome]